MRILLAVWLTLLAGQGWSEDFLAGVRGGTSFNRGSNRFLQTEVFGAAGLPWHWDFCSGLSLQPRLEASAGWLGGKGADAFIGTAGPVLELRKNGFPLSLAGGFSPTVLSRDAFGSEDFGRALQFTSHVDVNWNLTKHFTIGYRFQHMSNAGITNPNPGLNEQMISLTYRF